MTPEENLEHRLRLPSRVLRAVGCLWESRRYLTSATMSVPTADVDGPNVRFRVSAKPFTSPGTSLQVAT